MECSLLIVSFDPADAATIRLALAESDIYCTVHVDSYFEAVRVLRKQRFSMVLCDAELSPTCWKDLLSQIVMFTDPPAMILMSAVERQEVWAEAISLGVRDVLAKPLDKNEIYHVVSGVAPVLQSPDLALSIH